MRKFLLLFVFIGVSFFAKAQPLEFENGVTMQVADAALEGLKQQLFDRFLEANPVDVPNALIQQQVRDMQLDTARRMGAKEAAQVPPAEPFVEPARRAA